jgi:mannose-6-phosphate isomerase-like protein (cupin superfamily)
MLTEENIKERFIPFSSLRYTTEAFIDYCIPECSPKYNYALIGPGVSQNPKQPVSLREKHGFQVGGISMPHGKTNPAHMHFTAEVFICVKGDWQMQWGFNPGVQTADVGEGDVLTVPPWIYRGFRNIGVDDGFMFTGLGRDSTGGILWGPSTLQAAREQGVHLTEDYEIIDERAGQKWDASRKPLVPMTPEEIAALRVWSPVQMSQRIVRFADLDWSANALLDACLPGCGAQLAPVLGLGMSEDRDHLARVNNSHGFSIEWLRIPAGGAVSRHLLNEKQVLIAYRGSLEISVEPDDAASGAPAPRSVTVLASGSPQGWDSYAMPADCWRSLRNAGDAEAVVLLMTSGDGRKRITWADNVIEAAGRKGKAVDANGYVGQKHFIDRAQP